MSKNLNKEFENYFLIKAKDPAMLEKVKKAAEARGLSYLDAYCAIAPKFKDREKLERKLREMSEKEAVTIEGDIPATYKQSGPAVPKEAARAGTLDDSREAYHAIGEEKTVPPKQREELLENLVELEFAEPPKSKEQLQQSRTKTMPGPKKPAPAPIIKPKQKEEPEEIDIFADAAKQFEGGEAPQKLPDPLGSGLKESKPADAIKCEIPKYPSEEKYNLVKQLGKGGMGVVLEVTDNAIGRNVALKKIKGKIHPQRTARFDEEAKITGRLEHPNIIPVHEFVQNENERYFTMKLVKGEDLEKILEKKSAKEENYHRKYDRASLLRIFIDVCNALAYAHDHNVIHRDIKPANVMIGKFGEVLVMDWGLGKVIGTPEEMDVTGQSVIPMKSAGLTADGVVMGTPAYMAPEQAAGKLSEMDEKTDIFSLGAVLYELVTGKKPTPAKTMEELLQKRVDGVIDKMPMFTPKELESIILKAMVLEKNERYNTAEELAEDVQRYLDGELVKAHHYSVFNKIGRFAKKNAGKIILSGAGALMLTGTIAAISYFQGQASKAEADKAKAEARADKEEAEKIKAREKAVLAEKDKAKAEAIAANATAAKKTAEAKTLEAKAEAADLRATQAERIADADRIAREKRNRSNFKIQEGYLFYSNGEYELAIKKFNEAIAADTNNAEAYYNRSLAHRFNKQNELALEDALKATQIDSSNSMYSLTYINSLEEMSRLDEAEQILSKLVSNPGVHPLVILNAGTFYGRRLKFNKAIEFYEKYIQLMPKDNDGRCTDGRVYNAMANSHNGLKEYDQAKEMALLSINKKDFRAYYELGVAQYSTKEYDAAEKSLVLAKQHRNDRNNEIDFMLKEIEKLKKK